jgi:hypothetical protein
VTFDQTVLIWCLAVPAAISIAGCLVAKWSSQAFGAAIASTTWWLAVAAGLVGCMGWQWWPEDAWRRALWPLLAWAILVGGTVPWRGLESPRWVLAGLLAMITAAIAMPGGAGWEDTLDLHRTWSALIGASCLANAFALEHLSKTGGYRWSLLVALAALAGPMAMAAATYGSLAQWAFAMIVATFVIAAFAVFSTLESGLWAAAIPATAGGAGIAAAGRFYSYETHPMWLHAAVLFLPVMITVIDLPLRNRNPWIRVIVSGVGSAIIAGICIWRLLLS